MSWTYWQRQRKPRDFAQLEDWRAEQSDWVNSANALSAPQLPVESFSSGSFAQATAYDGFDTDPEGNTQAGIGSRGQTQAHFKVASDLSLDAWDRPTASLTTPTVPVLGPPQTTFGLANTFWINGINSFQRPGLPIVGTFMRIPCREGHLHIDALVDLEWSLAMANIFEIATPQDRGYSWRLELFLAVDGQIVASTGVLPAGCRKTYNLHASIPIKEGERDIDIKYRFTYEEFDQVVSYETPPTVNLFNAQLFARNQYR